VEDVQVCTADAGIGHGDTYFVGTWRHDRDVIDGQPPVTQIGRLIATPVQSTHCRVTSKP
jgi:hypothetical protein